MSQQGEELKKQIDGCKTSVAKVEQALKLARMRLNWQGEQLYSQALFHVKTMIDSLYHLEIPNSSSRLPACRIAIA